MPPGIANTIPDTNGIQATRDQLPRTNAALLDMAALGPNPSTEAVWSMKTQSPPNLIAKGMASTVIHIRIKATPEKTNAASRGKNLLKENA